MIGKSLRERHALPALIATRARDVMREVMGAHARSLVLVRAQGPQMVACVVVNADASAVRACKALGLAVKAGGTGVFGLSGADLVSLLRSELAGEQLAWLAGPCGPRETKVLLLAGGVALVSLEVNEGKAGVTVVETPEAP